MQLLQVSACVLALLVFAVPSKAQVSLSAQALLDQYCTKNASAPTKQACQLQGQTTLSASNSAAWSGTVQIDGGGAVLGFASTANLVSLAAGTTVILQNLELRTSAPDTTGTWALYPQGFQRASGARMVLQNVMYRVSCDQLVQYQIQLCTSLTPAVEVHREQVIYRQYSYRSVSATNVTLFCNGTRPILEAVKVTCATALADSTSAFNSALLNIGLNMPVYISSTIWLGNNVTVDNTILTAPGITFNVSNKLTLAAQPGLPYRPELDFDSRPGLFSYTAAQTAGVVIDGLKLVNMPTGPATQYSDSVLAGMGWAFAFRRKLLGSTAKRLVMTNTTMVLSDDEMKYWAYWLSMAPNGDSYAPDILWDLSLWAPEYEIVQPINSSRIIMTFVNGQYGGWDYYDVDMVAASATTTVAPLNPTLNVLARLRLPSDPPMVPHMGVVYAADLLQTSDFLVDYDDNWYAFRAAHRIMSRDTEIRLSSFAASTPVLSGPMLLVGDPVQPFNRYFNLHGLSMAVTVSKSGRMHLRDMIILNAGVAGGLSALQKLGTASGSSSGGSSSSSSSSLQDVAGNMTSLLWFWNFPRSLDAPVSYLNLTNVTLLVPDVEARVLVNLTLGGANTTDVALEPALQALLVKAAGRMQAVPSSWPPNGVTFPSFSWFGITGQNVTIAPVPAYTIKGIDLPFSVEVPRWLPWMAADSAGLAPPLQSPPQSPLPSPGPPPPPSPTSALDGDTIIIQEPSGDNSQQSRTVLIAAGVAAACAVLLTAAGAWMLRKRCLAASGGWGTKGGQPRFGDVEEREEGKPRVWVSNGAAGPDSGRVPGAAPGRGSAAYTSSNPSTMSSSAPNGSSSSGGEAGALVVPVPGTNRSGDAAGYGDLYADASSIIDNIVAKMAASNFNGLSAATPAGLQAVSRMAAQGGPAAAAGGKSPKTTVAAKSTEDAAAAAGGDGGENLLLRDPREEMRRTLEIIQSGSGEFQVEIHSEIGKGACGVVYRGVWRGLEVAIKRLVIQLLKGPQGDASRQLAMREAAINASLSHANIVATYSYGMCPLGQGGQEEQDGTTLGRGAIIDYHMYLIQEYCDKGSLYDAIRQKRLWNAEAAAPELYEAVRVMMDVAQGMAYLHDNNIVHADLKPDNILLKSGSPPASLDYNASSTSVPPQLPQAPAVVAKVADFGMSIKMQGNQTHVSGVRHGTPLYIAPEVLHDSRVSKAADAYSFGVILWECWKGCSAWTELMRLAQDTPMLRGIAYYPGLFTFEPQPQPDTPGYHFVKLAEACLSLETSQRPSFNTIINRLQFVAYMLETSNTAVSSSGAAPTTTESPGQSDKADAQTGSTESAEGALPA